MANDDDERSGGCGILVVLGLGIYLLVDGVQKAQCDEYWVPNATAINATRTSCEDPTSSLVWAGLLLAAPAFFTFFILLLILAALRDIAFRNCCPRAAPHIPQSPETATLQRQFSNTMGAPARAVRGTATAALGALHIELPIVARKARVTDPELRAVLGDLSAGEKHAECCICFEPLCDAKAAALMTAQKTRACAHYFHAHCAHDLMRSQLKTCPVCRTPVADVLEIPTVTEDPGGWVRATHVERTRDATFDNARCHARHT